MSTRLSDFDYALPEHLIASHPPTLRGDSRLLVVHRDSQTWEDRQFSDLPEYLHSGDVLVLNRTKVIPARLIGKRSTGGKIEIFLHQRQEGLEGHKKSEERWKVLSAPARKARPADVIQFDGLSCTIERDLGEGEKIVAFDKSGPEFLRAIERIGQVPLPPYIHRQPEEEDKNRYQTVFATVPGAVAAPTAGLHFTTELLDALRAKGVRIAYVTLHTGLGTFRPVEAEDITKHIMHEEFYELSEEDANIINDSKAAGKRCIAVGTTTVRTLETLAGGAEAAHHAGHVGGAEATHHSIQAGSGMSGIFIYPPYQFHVPDAIVTNFHLPKSTLIMMISAFAGREFLLKCYDHAIEAEYRFFSYGDAMLLL